MERTPAIPRVGRTKNDEEGNQSTTCPRNDFFI